MRPNKRAPYRLLGGPRGERLQEVHPGGPSQPKPCPDEPSEKPRETGVLPLRPQASAKISPDLATGALETDHAPNIFSNRLAVALEVRLVDSSRHDRQLETVEHEERSVVIVLAIRRGRELLEVNRLVNRLDGAHIVPFVDLHIVFVQAEMPCTSALRPRSGPRSACAFAQAGGTGQWQSWPIASIARRLMPGASLWLGTICLTMVSNCCRAVFGSGARHRFLVRSRICSGDWPRSAPPEIVASCARSSVVEIMVLLR